MQKADQKQDCKTCAGTKAKAMTAAAKLQIARTTRRACRRSAMRPAMGPETSRITVPAASNSPICAGVTPRDERNAGRNGEATPNAIYRAENVTRNLTRSEFGRVPSGMWLELKVA